ncbi:MAG: type VII secretion protein EccCa, partial [Micromonosporaceae bacterium]
MSTVLFRRPARRNGPETPNGDLHIQEPPVMPDIQPGGFRQAMTVLPMMLMTAVMLLLFFGPTRGPFGWTMMGLMGVAMVGLMIGQFAVSNSERKYRMGGDRRDYLRYLAQQRRRIRRSVTQQREASAWRHPDPEALWCVALTTRRWERRPTHPDFLEVRAGTGRQRLAVRIAPLQTKPLEDLEPLSAKSLRRFIEAYSTVADEPVAVFLPRFSTVHITGERRRDVLRALLAQIATFHAPEEVVIALCVSADAAAEWDWIKWLPHVQHQVEQDAAGASRVVAGSLDQLEKLLGEPFLERPRFEPDATASREEPYVVVVRDGGHVPANARLGSVGYRNTVLVDLDDPPATTPANTLWLDLADDELQQVRYDAVGRQSRSRLARPDLLGAEAARALATALAPYRLSVAGEPAEQAIKSDFTVGALLGTSDLGNLDVAAGWAPRTPADRLRVPIGVDTAGEPVELDLKESAQGGMGPHGMLIGATGSGKSELLRTLVLSLAMTHSSELLNFVLVDFKGGATFLGLDQLPHTSALITNLADEAALVGRMRDALHGELVRRQELLRGSGYASMLEYEKARAHGAPLDPLPTLFVVVDEFSELLATQRDFIELFVMIGRLGRSLGVHLLLASQRLDDGRISQLESHLSYRIGLRTFSAMESRSVIGVPDAHELPSQPGNGYLRTDVSTLIRFKAAYVSGAYRPKPTRRGEVVQRQVMPYLLEEVPHPVPLTAEVEQPKEPEDTNAPSVLSVVTAQLADQGPPAHQVWLPPLATPPTLDQLLPPLAPDPETGLTAVGWPGSGALTVPVGFVDKPFEQARNLLTVDLSGSGGHLGIAGGPQSGKSTLLRTVICSLALTHSPREVQFYCLDFGGGSLRALAGLPHVGGVAGRKNIDEVRRTVAEMMALLDEREAVFAEAGIDSMDTYRRRKAAGEFADDPFGDAFLVIDGWPTIRADFEELEDDLQAIAQRGLAYGVHLMAAANRWTDLRAALRDLFGTRLELRLGDPSESEINRRAAKNVPQRAPGRG